MITYLFSHNAVCTMRDKYNRPVFFLCIDLFSCILIVCSRIEVITALSALAY